MLVWVSIVFESHEIKFNRIHNVFFNLASGPFYVVKLTVIFRRKKLYFFLLQSRHNDRDCVSNHQRLDCWLNRLFRCISKKTQKLRVIGLCGGFHRSLVNSPHKGKWCGTLMFFFYLRLHKRLSRQSWDWWFETPSSPLWCHCNATSFSVNIF